MFTNTQVEDLEARLDRERQERIRDSYLTETESSDGNNNQAINDIEARLVRVRQERLSDDSPQQY